MHSSPGLADFVRLVAAPCTTLGTSPQLFTITATPTGVRNAFYIQTVLPDPNYDGHPVMRTCGGSGQCSQYSPDGGVDAVLGFSSLSTARWRDVDGDETINVVAYGEQA